MHCIICQHPKRPDIDQALITGSATLAALSQEYGLSTSALQRHKTHLQAKISQAKERIQDHLHQGCLFWLSQALTMTMQTAKTAQAEGNSKLVLRALAQGTRLAAIILKQDIPLDDRLVFELLSSPQWAAQDSLLPDDLNIISMSRQSLAGTLSSPCPAGNTPLSPLSSSGELNLYALQTLIAALDQPPAAIAAAGNHTLPTANRRGKRDKSGKIPGKASPQTNNSKENQDKLYEKIAGMAGFPSLSGNGYRSAIDPQLETLFQQWEKQDYLTANKPLSEYIHEQDLQHSTTTRNPGKGAPTSLTPTVNPGSFAGISS